MRYLMVSKKKIYFSCEGRIEKSTPRDHSLSSLGKSNGNPRDLFFCPTLTLMIDSYNIDFQKASGYDQEMQQSQTNPRYRETLEH